MLCWVGEAEIEKSNGAGGATVKAVLIMLLDGFGSPTVEADQVRVCVPSVAIHADAAVTVAGLPVGPA